MNAAFWQNEIFSEQTIACMITGKTFFLSLSGINNIPFEMKKIFFVEGKNYKGLKD
jgi:hypothetical protein